MQTNNLHIKNNVGYHGNVTFKLSINGKECAYKNEGTPELFRLFARALSGLSVKEDTPYYINGGFTIGTSPTETTFLRNLVYITARNFINDDEGGFTRFTATILPSDLINIPSSSTGVTYKFYLLKKDKTTTLADITVVDNTLFDNIPANTRIIIEWDMLVRND